MTEEDDIVGVRHRFAPNHTSHIDIGKGWYPILLTLDTALREIDPSIAYVQIKEKFGGLRVYTTRPSTENWNAVRRAKRKAQTAALATCESCGGAGSMHSRLGWYRTLCPSCAAEADYVPVPDELMSRAVARLAKIDALRVVDAEPTAEELILHAYVSGSDRDELVAALSAYPFTFPEYVEDSRRTGTWDQVVLAFYLNYITAEELGAVRAAVKPTAE